MASQSEPDYGSSAEDSLYKEKLEAFSPLNVGQKVWIIWEYREPIPEGECPACGGSSQMAGADGKSYRCAGEGSDKPDTRWWCDDGVKMTLYERYASIYEATVRAVEVGFYEGRDPVVQRAHLSWKGKQRGTRNDSAQVNLRDIFLTREEAENRFAWTAWANSGDEDDD